jgi:protein-S-isoprenylcysteine O-methyltransferase Ste14
VGGPYQWVRHPIYVGYAVTQIAFLLSHPSWWNLMVYAAAFSAQCMRISAEEKVLSQDPAYVAYMSKTPYRIVPFIF